MENKETLEEAAERLYSDKEYPMYGEIRRHSFTTGAKWQQEQDKKLYSEEDMFKFLDFINNRYYGSFSIDKEDLQEWFEQFKNK
jgi:hypothetical protein